MTYQGAIEAAKANVNDPKLSNLYLFIAAGFAKGDELTIVRELIANNDAEVVRRAA
ncbi:hypothetical protein LB533_20150 [Mesorhizobium sp. BR1-1-13]|uniref:hypothetical protein n=1 Tax=Mesorhizobium sp. BR1-1-13 TaxID=2876656 RepID=UPI001CD0D89E|nr:hypothetical protein [Mesorhizobium sp. BR1-1-13]MBZ9943401.1 hypothetical protein [Mesorhizobium sp. BR1-1-13]